MRAWPLLLLPLFACRLQPDPPTLPEPTPASAATAASVPALRAVPAAEDGLLPPVVHLHLTLPEPRPLAPAMVALVRGELSDTALRGLREGSLPASARARAVPIMLRSEGDQLLVFPQQPLDAGHEYTLAVGPLSLRFPLIIGEQAPPLLERRWPPVGAPSEEDSAIFCGQDPLPGGLEAEGLGPPLELSYGAPMQPGNRRCITLGAGLDGALGPFPVALRSGEQRVALAPASVDRAPWEPAAPLSCIEGEIALGPGCLLPQDDRLLLRWPREPWLRLDGDDPRPFQGGLVLRGFSPEQDQQVHLRVRDLRGQTHEFHAAVRTLAPRPHLLLTEALADPLGPEPASEWVELYNDGSTPVSLEGWALEDGQGVTMLPAHELAPGAFALLTNELLDTSSDAPLPPGCPVLPLPKLGKSGLSNQGEPLILRDPQGNVHSRLPTAPRPKPGLSLQRPSVDTADDGGGFLLHPPTPCAFVAPS
jgi:hypothetical protein